MKSTVLKTTIHLPAIKFRSVQVTEFKMYEQGSDGISERRLIGIIRDKDKHDKTIVEVDGISYTVHGSKHSIQDLYVISDESVEVGDYQIDLTTNVVSKRTSHPKETDVSNCRKIIKSTNTEINVPQMDINEIIDYVNSLLD